MKDFSKEDILSLRELIEKDGYWGDVLNGEIIVAAKVSKDQSYDTIVRNSGTSDLMHLKKIEIDALEITPYNDDIFVISLNIWKQMIENNLYIGGRKNE